RQLIAERFAPACGHDGEDVAARLHGLDDLGLPRPEVGEAEDPGEEIPRRVHASRKREIMASPYRRVSRWVKPGAATAALSSQRMSAPGAIQPPASADATAFSPRPRP